MNFSESQTIKNCTRAFCAECQDGAKYQYMADEATGMQLSYVSTILKQLATNEMAHAKIFYDYIAQNCGIEDLMVDIKATIPMAHAPFEQMLNIKAVNEHRQAEVVYPAFAKVARQEGFEDVASKMEEIGRIEEIHGQVLQDLYNGVKNKTLYESNEGFCWKCNNCGHEEVAKKAWKKCPLCQKPQGYVRIKFNGDAGACGCGDEKCGTSHKTSSVKKPAIKTKATTKKPASKAKAATKTKSKK